MGKIKHIALILLLFITQHSEAQHISNIDFTDIKVKTHDHTSIYFYPVLLQRFQSYDTTLTLTDMKYIYYGNVYYANYNPYDQSKEEEKFNALYTTKNYSDAIGYGLETFHVNPVNIRLLYNLIVCYDKIGDRVNAQKHANLYFPLLDVIYASGDGKSLNSAYVVIKVADEYDLLGDLELQITKQQLVRDVDVLTMNTNVQKLVKGEKKVKELYFNVRMPLLYLHQQVKKEGQ